MTLSPGQGLFHRHNCWRHLSGHDDPEKPGDFEAPASPVRLLRPRFLLQPVQRPGANVIQLLRG
jgi:hypothetical protein